jgi:molybdopterin molybdotransferase
MISLAEARAQIAKAISPLPTVTAPLHAAACHILREPIRASADIPPFDRATVDGYAVIANDPSKAFRVVTEIQPGAVSKRKIKPGECARIFTGAPVPASASQVIMQEDVRAADGLMEPLKRDEETNIHPRGADARRGDLLLAPGIRLGAGELSLLASLGRTQLKVSPRVPRPSHVRDRFAIPTASWWRR